MLLVMSLGQVLARTGKKLFARPRPTPRLVPTFTPIRVVHFFIFQFWRVNYLGIE